MIVEIKKGWDREYRTGKTLGKSKIVNGMEWTPVLWDDEEDPDWHKTRGLNFKKIKQYRSKKDVYKTRL